MSRRRWRSRRGRNLIESAVVTGAGRGIGAAVARRLAADGYRVAAMARSEPGVDALADEVSGVVALHGDASSEQDVAQLAATAAQLGRLAVWVNNAAVVERTAFADLTLEAWSRTLSVDLDGVFLGCRAAFLAMRGSGGSIVNIASLSGVANVEKFPGLAAYNVAKAGVIALTEAVALEGRDVGVRCVCLSPGAVDTDMLRAAAPHLRAGMRPDDVAEIIAWLITPAARHLSGVNIPIFSNR